ncbi:NtaA/DmoA family FMN-dependent monooxygenase [Tersicoccus sp. Bi-70]|uniref:NtaA/DmoA family FMN-dependent monooxygenase n=1 Tax=Tersicoccus sp. Bi-70 TaxID=1897634 RepID=UPI000978090D|nr:NtaA/DmoA family FMN-dependent monooxygenase [Tersicoccus sp. Bi-70]OMH34436.1 F420-dependent methylene-tetrahydromethanopterin reductase [Tersicoccus sp. Bi-70]
MSGTKKQIHLAAHFPGVNNATVWNDPASGSQIDIASFRHFAQNAERGLFDFLFLAEGLRLREHRGHIHDLDVVGRPNTLSILATLAGITSHLGLVGTLSATFNEPYELARQLQTLDWLSGGRAGWNVVTTSDAFTGENFRRGGYLDREDRYHRAAEFIEVSRRLWDSWDPGAVTADTEHGRFLADGAVHPVDHHGPQFDVSGYGTLPRSPQRHPVIVQAGDSGDGREFAAANAEVIFSRHSGLADAQAFYADVKGRLPGYGRSHDSLKIMPAVTCVIGDTPAEAEERARHIRRQQVSPQTAIALLEQVWGRDLSAYDPDGPLPDVDPDPGGSIVQGRVRQHQDALATANRWREQAEVEHLSIRELMIRVSGSYSFVGTPAQVAAEMDEYVQEDATDGFVMIGHLTPGGLDDVTDRVIPELQERGSFRTAYPEGATLRELLDLPPLEADDGVLAARGAGAGTPAAR